eukprot:136545_1
MSILMISDFCFSANVYTSCEQQTIIHIHDMMRLHIHTKNMKSTLNHIYQNEITHNQNQSQMWVITNKNNFNSTHSRPLFLGEVYRASHINSTFYTILRPAALRGFTEDSDDSKHSTTPCQTITF